MPFYGVQIDGIAELKRALREFEPALGRAFQRRLRDIAWDVATDARVRAGTWSKSIPPGISYGAAGRGAYVKYAGSAPTIGRLAENRGTWRHPLFGNTRHWYTQSEPGFLRPAVAARESVILAEAEAAVEEAKREVEL